MLQRDIEDLQKRYQFKMKPEMHYGEEDCPVSVGDTFPKDAELHFKIELIDFSKVKGWIRTLVDRSDIMSRWFHHATKNMVMLLLLCLLSLYYCGTSILEYYVLGIARWML